MERFRVIVELTWEIQEGERTEKHPGDTDRDFAARSFEALLRPLLTRLPVSHYHVVQRPDVCEE